MDSVTDNFKQINHIKEGQLALFFLVLGYLLALKCASSDSLLVWWTAAILLLGVALFSAGRVRLVITPLSLAAILLSLMVLLHLVFLPELIRPVDRFIGAFLILAPLVGLLLPRQLLKSAFPWLVFIFMLLAAWGLVQHLGGTAFIIEMGGRANSIFTTPNSFAAGLNLVCIILISLYLGGRLPRYGLAVILLLFAGLLASESRGGWISFGGAMVMLGLLHHWLGIRINRSKLIALTAGMAVLIVAYTANHVFEFQVFDRETRTLDADGLNRAVEHFPLMTMASSGNYRLRIYSDGWALIRERPWLGHGFMTFGDYYPRVQSDDYEHTVIFAHNDYLQFWAEMGLAGLLLLLLLIGACYWQLYRALGLVARDQYPLLIGLAAALSAFFAHALVDFVFYIPALFLVAAAYMGYVNQLSRDRASLMQVETAGVLTPRLATFGKLLLLIVPGWLLFEPALAQVVFQAGERLQQQGRTGQALGLYGLARQLVPNEPEYYRAEADYWLSQESGIPDVERLQKALELYAAAAAQNPFDLRSRYELAYLNVRFRDRLQRPAAHEQVRRWLEYVTERRPWDRDLADRAQALLDELNTQPGTV